MDTFQSLLGRKLSAALAAAGLPNAGELTQASDARFGDYQTNAALILAKQRGENPCDLAQRILTHLEVSDLCDQPQIAGAGFLNFTLRPEAVATKTTELLQDDRLGVPQTTSPRRIVIDFGSPVVRLSRFINLSGDHTSATSKLVAIGVIDELVETRWAAQPYAEQLAKTGRNEKFLVTATGALVVTNPKPFMRWQPGS